MDAVTNEKLISVNEERTNGNLEDSCESGIDRTLQSSPDLEPKPFFVYDSTAPENTLDEILETIYRQRTIGLALTFDPVSLKAGVENLEWLAISTHTPEMVYLFHGIQMHAGHMEEIINYLRPILRNENVTKVVFGIEPTVRFLYRRYFLEVNNFVDIQTVDAYFKDPNQDMSCVSTSLERLMQWYVDEDFPELGDSDDAAEKEPDWGQDPSRGTPPELVAIKCAYLLDVYSIQQQIIISPVVKGLGPELRARLKLLKNGAGQEMNGNQHNGESSEKTNGTEEPKDLECYF